MIAFYIGGFELQLAFPGPFFFLLSFFSSKNLGQRWSILESPPFFFDTSWHPQEQLYNLTPMVVSSLLLMGGAISIAAPLGIGSAIFSPLLRPTNIWWNLSTLH